MRMCDTHWQELRKAIADRGLESFVATNSENAAAKLEAQWKDGEAKGNFDPLMGAHNAILTNALELAGLYVLEPNDDGSERCPLCFLEEGCRAKHTEAEPCQYKSWPGRAADDMRSIAVRLGLLPTA
jgi:hypothetical protein